MRDENDKLLRNLNQPRGPVRWKDRYWVLPPDRQKAVRWCVRFCENKEPFELSHLCCVDADGTVTWDRTPETFEEFLFATREAAIEAIKRSLGRLKGRESLKSEPWHMDVCKEEAAERGTRI